MLVIDCTQSVDGYCSRMRVGVVGTCRVHNPLLSLVERDQATKLRRDFNTFTHGADEALQHIRYARRELFIPDALAPFIFGTDSVPELSGAGVDVARDLDLLVIEVCTVNHIAFHEYILQANFFARYFIGQKGSKYIEWWRSVIRGSDKYLELAEEIIDEGQKAGAQLSVLEEDILRSLKYTKVDAVTARQQVCCLSKFLGVPIVFVPHFSLESASRPKLVEREVNRTILSAAAKSAGQFFLDATPLLRSFGEENGLKNNGKDLHHYSEAFESHLGEAYFNLIQDIAAGRASPSSAAR